MYTGKIKPGMWFVRKVVNWVDVTTASHRMVYKEENIKITRIEKFTNIGKVVEITVVEITGEKLFGSFEDRETLRNQIIRKMTDDEIAIMNV